MTHVLDFVLVLGLRLLGFALMASLTLAQGYQHDGQIPLQGVKGDVVVPLVVCF